MTRSELISRLATLFPQLPQKDTELAVKAIFEALSNALAKGNRIEIRGFGSFCLNYRRPRTGRNPTTGKTVAVSAKAVPRFLAAKALRSRVDAGKQNEVPVRRVTATQGPA